MTNPFKIRVQTVGVTGASGSKYFSGLLDVNVDTVANNDFIVFDSANNKYKSANVSNVIPTVVKFKKTPIEISGNYAVTNADTGKILVANTSGNTFITLRSNIEIGLTFSVISANAQGNIILTYSANSYIQRPAGENLFRAAYNTISFMPLRLNGANLDWIIL